MALKIIFILSLIVAVNSFLLDDDMQTVTTPVGDIIGTTVNVPINSTFGYKVQRFTGIPYAEAPTGNLRFKKPVPKAAFKTPFDARKDSNRLACYQRLYPGFEPSSPLSEDCLRLNIYIPGDDVSSQNTDKPVMVWIHGGGFVLGESYFYNASVLSTYGDVIVVTINYRVAQLGFLTTGDSNMPGNLGLWDQHLAIKWVHDNIKAFGGDVNRITIFGESAGSASVVYQTFYPGNKGLFQRAIAESGSSGSYWALQSLEHIQALTRQFANDAGCSQAAVSDYVKCMASTPINVINHTMAVAENDNYPAPFIDNEFVLDNPANLLSGNTNATNAIDMFLSVDLMIGFNSADGLVEYPAWLFLLNETDADNITKKDFEDILVPYYIETYYNITNTTEAAKLETIHVYTDWSNPDDYVERLRKLTDISTDISFAVPGIKTANQHISSNRSTYVYEFFAKPTHRSDALPTPKVLDTPTVVNHGEEIFYLFGFWINEESENASLSMQYKTTQATMTFWSNFAKSGNPNMPVDPTQFTNTIWPKYTDGQKYLEISLDMGPQSVKSRARAAAVNLWDVLLPELLEREAV